MARAAPKKDVSAAGEPDAPAGPASHGILSGIASGLFGGLRDRIVTGVGRPLAGGFVLGVGLAVAVGLALHATLSGLAGLVVSPYSDSVRPLAQGLVTLALVATVAFAGIRIATRRRGRAPEPGKTCPACLEAVPAAATKCRACGSDV